MIVIKQGSSPTYFFMSFKMLWNVCFTDGSSSCYNLSFTVTLIVASNIIAWFSSAPDCCETHAHPWQADYHHAGEMGAGRGCHWLHVALQRHQCYAAHPGAGGKRHHRKTESPAGEITDYDTTAHALICKKTHTDIHCFPRGMTKHCDQFFHLNSTLQSHQWPLHHLQHCWVGEPWAPPMGASPSVHEVTNLSGPKPGISRWHSPTVLIQMSRSMSLTLWPIVVGLVWSHCRSEWEETQQTSSWWSYSPTRPTHSPS